MIDDLKNGVMGIIILSGNLILSIFKPQQAKDKRLSF
jgi:hypothetical protein